jgi:hypothetical protein
MSCFAESNNGSGMAQHSACKVGGAANPQALSLVCAQPPPPAHHEAQNKFFIDIWPFDKMSVYFHRYLSKGPHFFVDGIDDASAIVTNANAIERIDAMTPTSRAARLIKSTGERLREAGGIETMIAKNFWKVVRLNCCTLGLTIKCFRSIIWKNG